MVHISTLALEMYYLSPHNMIIALLLSHVAFIGVGLGVGAAGEMRLQSPHYRCKERRGMVVLQAAARGGYRRGAQAVIHYRRRRQEVITMWSRNCWSIAQTCIL